MNYEVRDEAAEKVLKDIGGILRDTMPKGYGFYLLIFNFGDGGNMFYMSNAERDTMIAAMREFIAKHEHN